MANRKHQPAHSFRQQQLTRRVLLRGMAGAAVSVPMAGLLAACGEGDNDAELDAAVSTATEPPTVSNEPTSEPTGETEDAPIIEVIEVIDETSDERTLKHALGETTIPANPQRIVALTSGSIDSLVALDIQPAGIATFTGHDFTSFSYLEPQLREIPIVGTFIEPNFEAVLAAGPDLIIAPNSPEEGVYEQLSQIAPTVAPPDTGGDFRAYFRNMGAVLGREDEVEARIKEYEAKAADARAALDEAVGDETAAFLRVLPDEYRVYGNARLVGPIIYGDLGLEPDPLVRELAWEENAVVISNERIPDFSADHIFLLDQSQGTKSEGDIDALTDDPLWQTVPAIQQGNVYRAERDIWINIGLIAAERVVDAVREALVGEDSAIADTSTDWTPPEYAETAQLLEIIERTDDTVTIRDQYGQQVDVPANPQRVIADYDPVADMLLSLGIKPVAMFTFSNPDFAAVLAPMLDGVENLPATGGPNLEAVLALEPDLIIDALTRDRQIYDQLSRIAPTFSIGEIGISLWRTALRDLGLVLGRSEQAEQALAKYEQKVAKARARLQEAGIYNETVACVRAREKQYRLYGTGAEQFDGGFYPTNLTAAIYADLELVPPQMVRDIPRADFTVDISLEVLPDLNADHLFIRREHEESFQELMNSPLLQAIPAVQQGNVYVHTDDEWTTGGPILNTAWLDLVVNDLLGE